MATSSSQNPQPSTRRDRFREYMARLASSSDPARAIREGLYVERPGNVRSVAEQIRQRIDLEPSSSHLIVGGIGSGKTTQLLVACELLRKVPDVWANLVDVSHHHDLTRLRPGVLIVLTGLVLADRLSDHPDPTVARARKHFKDSAHGWIEWVQEFPDDEPPDFDEREEPPTRPIKHAGVLVPPESPLRFEVKRHIAELAKLKGAIAEDKKHLVVLFDSLDRLTDLEAFGQVVHQDLKAIKRVGIGVVLVGPLRCLFGAQRTIVDRFDNFYHQPAVDVERDATGARFLVSVLRKRVSEQVLPAAASRLLVKECGGVFRDLLTLARSAGEESYVAGAEKVRTADVKIASDSFGRSLMLGLDSEEIEVLQRLRKRSTFVQTSDKSIALLVSRRIIEYGDGRPRFAVHPTIAHLLEGLGTKV